MRGNRRSEHFVVIKMCVGLLSTKKKTNNKILQLNTKLRCPMFLQVSIKSWPLKFTSKIVWAYSGITRLLFVINYSNINPILMNQFRSKFRSSFKKTLIVPSNFENMHPSPPLDFSTRFLYYPDVLRLSRRYSQAEIFCWPKSQKKRQTNQPNVQYG